MSHPQAGPQRVNRIQHNLLARTERQALNWLCARLPRWVMPDHLTGLALVLAALIFTAYALSNENRAWLWLAVAGYLTHWFGDSLDGSLARFRRIERPRYGYFIDHSCDGLAILLILGGLGSSPYVRVGIAFRAHRLTAVGGEHVSDRQNHGRFPTVAPRRRADRAAPAPHRRDRGDVPGRPGYERRA